MNTLNIIARLTREPESKFTPTGKQITSFGIAYDMGFGDHKRACFLDCKLWGERGENFIRFVKKGHAVALTGSLDMESWEDKTTGQKRTKHVMEVRDFTLLSNRREEGEEAPAKTSRAPQAQRQQPPRPAQQESHTERFDDDDIAF